MLALAAVLLLCWFSGEVADTDIWLHLKTGQLTWQNRALTVPDPFSYTSGMGGAAYAGEAKTRYFNLTHEWLAQIVTYWIHAAAGFPGLVLARAVLLTAFCALVGLIAFRRTNGFYRSLAAALAAGGVAIHFQQSRPFLVTFLLLAVTMALVESRGASRSRVWLLPPVFLLWANCHGGYFMGWVMLGVYCAEALVQRLRKRPVEDERRLWLASAACFLVSGLNPNGFRVIEIMMYYRSSSIQATNLEWQYPAFWQPSTYSFLLFGSLVVLLLAWRRTRPVDWLLYLVFGAASLMAVRNTILMGLVGPVLVAAYMPTWKRALPVFAEFAAAGLVLIGIGAAVASGGAFQLRAAEWQVPSGAADFLAAHRVSGRMFNTYESGGYLVWRLWPMQRDFVDPRGLSEEAYADYKRILFNADSTGGKSAEELLEKYGIQVLVMEGFEYFSGQVHLLAAALADPKQTEWKLVYADAECVIFMRQPPAGVQPLNSLEAIRSLELQCEQHIRHDPRYPRCARGLSDLYVRIGDAARARQWMAYYLEHRAEADPDAERIYQRMTGQTR